MLEVTLRTASCSWNSVPAKAFQWRREAPCRRTSMRQRTGLPSGVATKHQAPGPFGGTEGITLPAGPGRPLVPVAALQVEAERGCQRAVQRVVPFAQGLHHVAAERGLEHRQAAEAVVLVECRREAA